VSFHDHWTIMMIDINRPRRRIVVMVMDPMLIVAISVPPVMPTVVVCKGYAGSDKDHNGRNY
jgi:hypothetical protein